MKFYRLLTTVLGLILAACSSGSHSGASDTPNRTALRFTDATKISGVDFQHIPTRTENKWLPEIMGSGVAAADFNRDGAPDLLFVNSGSVAASERPAAARNRLYINDGKGHFSDQTDAWNLTGKGYGQGVAVGDYDNDGWTDVFLTNFEGDNRLLKNTGTVFEDVTDASGISSDDRWATSAGFFDYDADGDLDLYVVKYVDFTTANPHKVYRNRMQIYATPIYFNGLADQLWRNDGGGKFSNVTGASDISSRKGNGLALALGDIDLDGDQDIYVANDSDANMLFINEAGKFKEIGELAGCAYSELGREEGSMGVDFSDVDGNNRPDITVTNFQEEPTSLYSQVQPLLFREISDSIGIGEPSRARLKFGIDLFDADNDGDEDLLFANGHIEDTIEQNSDTVTFAQANSLLENLGGGKFVDVSDAAGNAQVDRQVSRGLITADLNGDGLLDYVISNNGGTAQIAFNETAAAGSFVIIWLDGDGANRNAIGARIVAKMGERTIERQIMGSQSYMSVSDFRVHVGLGDADKIDELTIYWPSGKPQMLKDIPSSSFQYIREGQPAVPFVPGERQIL